MIKKTIAVLLIFVMCASLSSCNINAPHTDDTQAQSGRQIYSNDDVLDRGPVRGGAINLFTTVPDTLNPIFSNNIYVQDFSRLIFEGLVKIGKDQSPIPMLSDRWEVSPDGLTWTFHIRDNVLWHDGIPLTAEDVEFTMSTILNPEVKSIYKSNLHNVIAFAALDRSTLRVVLKNPNSFTAEMMTFPIISKHTFEGEDILKSERNMKPVGTGPYKFVSYDGNVVKLVANEAWWKTSQDPGDKTLEKPYINEVDIKVYKNASDALNALQSENVDVVFTNALESSRYNGNTRIAIKKYPGKNFEYITFNLSNPVAGDKSVRQAIEYAIDRKKIIDGVLQGGAVESDIPLIPGTWLNDKNIIPYNHDIEKAKQVLEKNGWFNSGGTLYKRINGVTRALKLELLVNSDNETRMKIADNIKQQLAQVGINVKVTSFAWDKLFNRIQTRKFDMAVIGVSITNVPDVSFAYSSSEANTGKNLSGYSNPQVDSLIQQIMNEKNLQTKKELFDSMRSIINDEVPYVGLFFYSDAVLYSKRIRGDLNPYFCDRYYDITGWYIPR